MLEKTVFCLPSMTTHTSNKHASATKAARTFGANLRDARTAAGLTQEALADRLGFKRTTAISLWERSDTLPEPHTIEKLARALDVAPAVLLRDVVTPYDLLRGKTVVADGAAPSVTPDEVRHVESLRLLDEPMRRALSEYIEALLRATGHDRAMNGGATDGRYGVAPSRARAARRQATRASTPTSSTR